MIYMVLNDPLVLFSLLAFLAAFSLLSYKKKLLDYEGVLVGNAVGLAAITYGPNPLVDFFVVVVFFVLGEIASNYPRKKHGQRNIWNVLGNSLPALLMLILIVFFPSNYLLLELCFFGAISAALADTLSSEVGYYSKSSPVMITTFKKVPRGTDGGVTLLGEAAALFGGLVIALIYFFVYQNIFSALAILAAGIIGSNVDSVFGGVFETKGKLDKTQVNLIGSLSGAVFCFLLGVLI
ncbi:Uncharacterised protein [uncultured archaeon]|nr:Uncharacterised protein [uncultured archaeon]